MLSRSCGSDTTHKPVGFEMPVEIKIRIQDRGSLSVEWTGDRRVMARHGAEAVQNLAILVDSANAVEHAVDLRYEEFQDVLDGKHPCK